MFAKRAAHLSKPWFKLLTPAESESLEYRENPEFTDGGLAGFLLVL